MSATARVPAASYPQPESVVHALRPGELVAVGELLYQRVFALAVWGIGLAASMAVIAAIPRTREADLLRTAALAALLIAMSYTLGRASAHVYRAMRRHPALCLAPAGIALLCVCLDGINHSPLSFPAGVTVAVAAYACGTRWGLAAAALLAGGVITATAMSGGPPWEFQGAGDVPSVTPGAAGYFLYALLVGILGDRFAKLALHLNTAGRPSRKAPMPVPNLADPGLSDGREAESAPSSTQQQATALRPGSIEGPLGKLTARQLQVVLLLAEGLRATEIAHRLGVRPKTVYAYVHQATQRTGTRNRTELVTVAARAGLLERERPDPPTNRE